MAKDPAFLFYASDFLTGIQDLTMEERGQYITLLCIEHQKGRLSKKLIKIVVGDVSTDVLSKFKRDESGLYYNERLEGEIDKRKQHSDKQRTRALDGWKKRKESHSDATALPQETPIAHEPIKQNGVNVDLLFNELPNTSHIETIAMRTGMTKERVLSLIPEFRKAAELTYPTPDKFYSHFKNWVNKRITEHKPVAKKRNQI